MTKGNPRCRADIVFLADDTLDVHTVRCEKPFGHEGSHQSMGEIKNFQNKELRSKKFCITWDTEKAVGSSKVM